MEDRYYRVSVTKKLRTWCNLLRFDWTEVQWIVNLRAVIPLFIASVAFSQATTLTPTASPSSVRPGATTTVTLTLSGAPSVADLQWAVIAPLGWIASPTTATALLTGAQKQVQCGAALCVAWGLNITTIPVGGIATFTLTAPATALPGTVSISLTNTLGASGNPTVAVPVTTAAATITVISVFDITGDGQITQSDVLAMAAQVSSGACTADPVGNGMCTIQQVHMEIVAWMAAGSKP